MKITRTAKIASAVAVAALALSGVSLQAANAASSSKTVYILGGGDQFFSIVKNGFNSATKAVQANGWKTKWLGLQNYDNIGPDMVKLIRTAVSQKAAAIGLPDWVPDAENPEIKKAIAAGIPVFLYNAGGQDQMKASGALAYAGTDEYEAGKALGGYLASKGAKHGLCINTSPGSVNIEARCKGMEDAMKAAGGKGEALALPSTSFGNATAISNAVKGALTKDTSIDAVFTISSADTDATDAGIKASGVKAQLGSFDVSVNILNRISAGTQAAAVDQLGWLQGYMVTSMAWQYAAYGMLPATTNFLTGPSMITKDNAAKILAASKTGQR